MPVPQVEALAASPAPLAELVQAFFLRISPDRLRMISSCVCPFFGMRIAE